MPPPPPPPPLTYTVATLPQSTRAPRMSGKMCGTGTLKRRSEKAKIGTGWRSPKAAAGWGTKEALKSQVAEGRGPRRAVTLPVTGIWDWAGVA